MRREFSAKVKTAAFQRANKRCEECTASLFPGKFIYDHRIPDWMGGEPTLENCQVICVACDKKKTKGDKSGIAKSKRVIRRHIGARTARGRAIPGTKASGWKRKMDGTWERRTRAIGRS